MASVATSTIKMQPKKMLNTDFKVIGIILYPWFSKVIITIIALYSRPGAVLIASSVSLYCTSS